MKLCFYVIGALSVAMIGRALTIKIRYRSVNDDDDDDDDDGRTRFLDILPNDVLVNILSRLDLATLCRCVTVSPKLSVLLPEIRHLDTTLPPSVILYSKPNSVFERFFGYLFNRAIKLNSDILFKVFVSPLLLKFTVRICTPKFSKPADHFLRRLTGLESLEIEYDIPDSLNDPNSYFRWVGEQDSETDFFLYLDATVIPQNEDTLDPLSCYTIPQRCIECLRHYLFHISAGYPVSFKETECGWPDKLRTMVVKDDRKNGRYIFRSTSAPRNKGFRRRFSCYLPTEVVLVLANESLRIQNTNVCCVYHVNDIDKDMTLDEFVTTRLKNTRDYCVQDKELLQIVQLIIRQDELIVVEDSIEYYK